MVLPAALPGRRVAAERSIEAFADTAAFRAWLAEHHATSPGIWLKVAKKNSGLATTTHDEALEAALAYGWIDGQARPGDETYWLQGFTRRTSRSPWSKRNCDNAERLIANGHMEPAGLAEVDRAKADGRWARAYDGQRDIQEPADLVAALAENRPAADFYATLNRTNRYAILYRIQDAKRPETRANRIAKFVEMLARGEKIYG
jgi:uncharacterized protein YdeI (YjbR/CyaY-like superfamily)